MLTLGHFTILLPVEVDRVLILQIVEVFAEELGSFFEDTWHLLSRGVNQDHLGDVNDICLVRLLRQVAFVDIESLEIDTAHQLTVRSAKFLDEAEDFIGISVATFSNELLQVVEEFVKNLSKEGTLADRGLTKEQVYFFAQARVVFVEIKEDDFDLVVIKREYFVESLDTM